MALLTDGPISAITGLQAHDSSILDTARTEGIDLDKKIELAQQELEIELSVFLLRAGDGTVLTLNGGVDLRKAVVTAAIERWHIMKTLAATYCDAYSSQLNDRYLSRWTHYAQQAHIAGEAVMELGVGVVRDPLPRPAAPSVTASGTPGEPVVWEFQMAWRGLYGTLGAPSEKSVYSVAAGSRPVVQPPAAPPSAIGWDVFAALAGSQARQQNTTMLTPGSSWMVPATGLVDGALAGPGQVPDYFVRRSRVLPRG